MGQCMKSGQYLELQWNTYSASVRIPKDLQKTFGKCIFKKSLGTSDFREAEILKLPLIAEWKRQIKAARAGKLLSAPFDEKVQQANQMFNELGAGDEGLAAVASAIEVVQNFDELSDAAKDDLRVYGVVSKGYTPTDKYVDEWLNQHGYDPQVADGARSFLLKRFCKKFPFFETISKPELVKWIDELKVEWAIRTVRKNFGYIKLYWSYCAERYTEAVNLTLVPGVAPSISRTKANKQASTNTSYVPFEVEDLFKLLDEAKNRNDQNLEDAIKIGMYTGMRLGEILHMKVTEVGSDRFTVTDSKTYSGLRDIPIHSDIQQLVERLIQTSEDGFLISGESANNKYKVRTKGISHRFSRLKAALGFRTKREVFHSLRGTLANRFENAGVNETFAARIIGHQIETMTYGVYSGQIDWDKAVEAMSQVQYLQPTKKDPEGS